MAGEVLNTPRYAAFARHSLDYYIAHCNLTNFLAPNMLLHFYCYIQEALFDLGADDICRSGMKNLAEYQADSGFVPAYAGERWVCTPGLIQAGLVWCKLHEEERGHAALRFAQSVQSSSGGFIGGIGEGATYFPEEELPWAIKFWLDALALQKAGLVAPMQDISQGAPMPVAPELAPRELHENEIPVIRLESAAIGELERLCLNICKSDIPQADLLKLDGAARSIPVLLDWGRRSQALTLAEKLEKACASQLQRGEKIWETREDLFFLAHLIRAFRQPEVLQAQGDAMLRPLCLAVLQRQRQSATSIRGLFSCFNELREAGRTLQVQGWVDCADHWAKAQGGLLDQSATPDLVQESVSAGLLLGSDVGKALLRRIFSSVGRVEQNRPEDRRRYARMALTLAWGAWALGDEDLGRTSYCQGVSALMTPGGEEKYFHKDIQACLAFLEALKAMQSHRFALYFPNFMDDISSDDGRLLFVKRHLPQGLDSHVLDLGTGKGRYLRRLHYEKNVGSLVGQDVHPAFARFMPKGVGIGVGTVLRAGWQDESFNGVLLCEVLEHCIDLPAALKEMHRILAVDGVLIIVDKNVERLASWSGDIPPWEQWFDCGELVDMLRSNGFSVEAVEADIPYEGRRDGLFFGIAAKKKEAADCKTPVEVLPAFNTPDRPYNVFDPRVLLGDSLGLAFYTAVAESLLKGKANVEIQLYAKYLSHFPLETDHSPDIFTALVKSMEAHGYDYMYPVAALPKASIFSNGVHRMAAAIALGIKDVPYLYTASNNISQAQVIEKILSATEFRWVKAQQKRLIGELPQSQRLLCQLRNFIVNCPESFRDAPFSSTAPIQGCILSYQGLDKIGLTGKRSAEKRFKIYQLDKYISKDMEVLETGCNCGFLSWLMADHARHVDAFDVDKNYIQLGSMLKQEYNTENLKYYTSRFEEFCTAKKYDFIVSCAVYGWVPIPFAAFVERLDGWLKPGGILLFESHELIVHPEWKQQRAFLADRYELLHADYIDDVDHAFYASEYREFLILRKK